MHPDLDVGTNHRTKLPLPIRATNPAFVHERGLDSNAGLRGSLEGNDVESNPLNLVAIECLNRERVKGRRSGARINLYLDLRYVEVG